MTECKAKYTTNYVITSGWWCGDSKNEKRVRHGSESIREVDFFNQWKTSILANTNPLKIMVLDSASEIKPSTQQRQGIEFISINKNPGHSTYHTGKYSGYMRSIIMGITYAKLCDADYWVYVEQDVLLKGEGIIEHCISKMDKPFMFGSGEGTPQFLQQSLIIIRKDGFDQFLTRLNNIKSPDSLIAPETKFLIATSTVFQLIPEWIYHQLVNKTRMTWRIKKYLFRMLPIFKGFDELPVGFGRTRPIKFEAPYYYFQHGSEDELKHHYNNKNNYDKKLA